MLSAIAPVICVRLQRCQYIFAQQLAWTESLSNNTEAYLVGMGVEPTDDELTVTFMTPKAQAAQNPGAMAYWLEWSGGGADGREGLRAGVRPEECVPRPDAAIE